MRKSLTFIFISLLVLLGACSRTKDTFTSRTYHRMVSKYNALFNGEQAILKLKDNIRQAHKDDFDNILPIYIEGDEKSIAQVKPDIEKAIEKGTKVIKQHSMHIKNVQKNSYIDDAYLLIGVARYYDQDYLPALETFNYIIQEFRSNPKMVAEAELWAAKTETGLENYLAAESRFQRLYGDKRLSKHLNAAVFASFAALELQRDDYLKAYQLLIQAAEKTDDREEEIRWLYICGQLQASLGNDFEASQLFERVVKKGPPYELLFNAQLNQARNYDIDLMDPMGAYDALEKMLKDEKNFDNRDKIYYVMAEVAEKLEDPDKQIHFLNRSVRTSTVNQVQKGLSYLKLADIHFLDRKYEDAQAYYDSTSQSLPPDHPKYARVMSLKESLGKIVQNLQTIALQDSLIKLSEMGPKQREQIVADLIEKLREEEEERQRQESRAMDNLVFNAGNNTPSGPTGLAGMGSANQQFYFYNPTLRSSGVSAFTTRWGNRKLEDNWRRKDKQVISGSAGGGDGGEATQEGDGEEEGLDPKYDPATYLARVPTDSAALDSSHRLIQSALLDNGLIYKEEIKDYLEAAETILELLKRYPQYEDLPRAWYILYRLYLLQELPADAEKYKQLILQQYPDSEYAYLILNDGKPKVNFDEEKVRLAYEKAYRIYEAKDYRQAYRAAEAGAEEYQDSKYGARFWLLKAYCQGALQRKEDLRETLEGILKTYPQTDESAEAQKILDMLGGGEEPGVEEGPNQEALTKYKKDFNTMHRYVLVVPNGKGSPNDIAIKLSNFCNKYFPNDRLRTKNLLMGTEYQLIMVSGLANKGRAMNFMQTLTSTKTLEMELLSIDYKQFVISNANFTAFYKEQDLEVYQAFFKENYQK